MIDKDLALLTLPSSLPHTCAHFPFRHPPNIVMPYWIISTLFSQYYGCVHIVHNWSHLKSPWLCSPFLHSFLYSTEVLNWRPSPFTWLYLWFLSQVQPLILSKFCLPHSIVSNTIPSVSSYWQNLSWSLWSASIRTGCFPARLIAVHLGISFSTVSVIPIPCPHNPVSWISSLTLSRLPPLFWWSISFSSFWTWRQFIFSLESVKFGSVKMCDSHFCSGVWV